MPHAIRDVVEPTPLPKQKSIRKSKSKSPSRDLQQLSGHFDEIQAKYESSEFSKSIERLLKTATKSPTTPVTRLLSLGLGTLTPIKTQTRRLKQLAIFLAIANALERTTKHPVALYAQDPTFTRTDEAFLTIHGVTMVRTPSGAELGEAQHLIDATTLVYSPFLTLEAYEQMLLQPDQEHRVRYLVGDDFNALLAKWPKHSAEREQVEKLLKTGVSRFRRRALSGEGFWDEEDKAFPMAMYSLEDRIRVSKA
jgi:hypothetical protein